MDIKTFVQKTGIGSHVADLVSLWTIDPTQIHSLQQPFTNIHSYIFVLQGELTIRANGSEYVLTPNHIADIMESSLLQLISASHNFVGYLLLLENHFFHDIIKSNPPFPVSYPIKLRFNPRLKLENSQMKVMLKHISRINDTICDRNHSFQKEVLQKECSILIMEIGNIIIQGKMLRETGEVFDRKRSIVMQFFDLLAKNSKSEHSVSFYASTLNISNQYLARIIKEVTNLTVYECISRALVFEIIKYLNETTITIQQIADNLNFSDQAALTKFFKKHMGISPTKYKKKNAS